DQSCDKTESLDATALTRDDGTKRYNSKWRKNEKEHNCSKPSNITCQQLKFSQKALPKTALFSFPGSGNTWLRHLIQQMTGFYTGSIYNDTDLKMNGFPGEDHTGGDVVVTKTHSGQSLMELYDRTIVIIRNPFHAIYACFQYFSKGHVDVISEDTLRQNEAIRVNLTNAINDNRHMCGIKACFPNYLLALKQYRKEKMLIVHYENLKTKLREELLRIRDFLNMTVDQSVIDCALCNSEGYFHRKGKNFNPYTEADMLKIATHIKAMNETLRETCGLSCTFPYSISFL
ncbi:unnamed protein product, partial [Owenia fusiformis]